MKTSRPTVLEPSSEAPDLRMRSGAVARILGMPVTTLRVWERRYGLSQAPASPGGQRLYAAEDVRRLALIKQLTEQGHAIGRLAGLALPALQALAHTHAQAAQQAQSRSALLSGPRRLAVVGAGLGLRLTRPALSRPGGLSLTLLGPFADLGALQAAVEVQSLDALLIHAPQLSPGLPAQLEALGPALKRVKTAVLYGFAADAVCEALSAAGIRLLREPQPDVVLAQWLGDLLCADRARPFSAPDRPEPAPRVPAGRSARRWDDAALLEVASRSSTIACECPRHVAELLMQLSHFEAYSALCESRSVADAEVHAYLSGVAAEARALFETALERVAAHEGLPLPASDPN